MGDQAERLRELVRSKVQEKPTRVIAVTSGKGGVGKTNLSVNLGIALAQQGAGVLLVDADLGMANVDVLLGVVPKYGLGEVVNGQRTMEEIIINGPCGLKVISSGSGDYKLANLSRSQLQICLRQLNEIGKDIDIILVDTGAGISRNVLKFVMAADEVIIVTTPEPTAITDAYGVIKILANSKRDFAIWLVINMIDEEREGKQVMERLAVVSKRFLDLEITNIGYIPRDPNVPKSVKEQQPFIVCRPRSAAAQNVQEIAKNLLNRSAHAGGLGNFFTRLFSGKFN